MKRIIIGLFAALALSASAQITNVNVGTTNNDMMGDPLRLAFEKLNASITYLSTNPVASSRLTTSNLTSSTTGVTVTGGTGAVIGTGTSITIQNATTAQPGLLTAADWNTFNGKLSSVTFSNLKTLLTETNLGTNTTFDCNGNLSGYVAITNTAKTFWFTNEWDGGDFTLDCLMVGATASTVTVATGSGRGTNFQGGPLTIPFQPTANTRLRIIMHASDGSNSWTFLDNYH